MTGPGNLPSSRLLTRTISKRESAFKKMAAYRPPQFGGQHIPPEPVSSNPPLVGGDKRSVGLLKPRTYKLTVVLSEKFSRLLRLSIFSGLSSPTLLHRRKVGGNTSLVSKGQIRFLTLGPPIPSLCTCLGRGTKLGILRWKTVPRVSPTFLSPQMPVRL